VSETDSIKAGNSELIKHLSSEIATQSEYLGTLRARMGLTFVVGPFVVFGSFLLATKSAQTLPQFSKAQLPAAIVAASSYILLGLYAAMLDAQVTDQCDRWRRAIIKLSNNEPAVERDVLFRHHTYIAYIIGWVLTFSAFVSIVWLLSSMLSQAASIPTPKG
jgi:hypothetical protein